MNPLMTLFDIYDYNPCEDSWGQFLTALGQGDFSEIESIEETLGKFDPELEVSLGDIALVLGAADALWCLPVLDWEDVALRKTVVAGVLLPIVERTKLYTNDKRIDEIIDVLRKWCEGKDVFALIKKYHVELEDLDYMPAATRTAFLGVRAATGKAYAVLSTANAARTAAFVSKAFKAIKIECEQQRADIIAAFPPVVLAKGENDESSYDPV